MRCKIVFSSYTTRYTRKLEEMIFKTGAIGSDVNAFYF